MYLQIHWIRANIIEILNPEKTVVIVGYIYCHPRVDFNKFNDHYINNTLDKLSKENETVFLIGDFNLDLSSYDQHWTYWLPFFWYAPVLYCTTNRSKK